MLSKSALIGCNADPHRSRAPVVYSEAMRLASHRICQGCGQGALLDSCSDAWSDAKYG